MEYENGKAIPNNQFISKMERMLQTKLPRAKKKKKNNKLLFKYFMTLIYKGNIVFHMYMVSYDT